jgi:hypothetical protein
VAGYRAAWNRTSPRPSRVNTPSMTMRGGGRSN